MQDRSASSMIPLATHGRTIHQGQNSPFQHCQRHGRSTPTCGRDRFRLAKGRPERERRERREREAAREAAHGPADLRGIREGSSAMGAVSLTHCRRRWSRIHHGRRRPRTTVLSLSPGPPAENWSPKRRSRAFARVARRNDPPRWVPLETTRGRGGRCCALSGRQRDSRRGAVGGSCDTGCARATLDELLPRGGMDVGFSRRARARLSALLAAAWRPL